jgi:hypothetical protein
MASDGESIGDVTGTTGDAGGNGGSSQSTPLTMEEKLGHMLERIAELEHQVRVAQPQKAAPQIGTKRERKLELGQPFMFDGSRKSILLLINSVP